MTTASVDYRTPRALVVTVAFIALVVIVGGIIGINNTPDAWYQSLVKAPFNPPNWVFAPVWFVLYVLIGIAGARTFLRNPASAPMAAWGLQMVLNWAWSPVWFTLHLLWPAYAVIVAIFAAIVWFIVASWRTDRAASWLFVPYAAWVAFASTLNLWAAVAN